MRKFLEARLLAIPLLAALGAAPAQEEPPGQPAPPPGASGKEGPKGEARPKAGPKAPGGKEGAKGETKGEKASAPPLDLEQAKALLQERLQGEITFGEDGMVTVEYDLRLKKEEFQDDFRPAISTKPQAPFRWSIYQEERTIGGDYGVRISDKGSAFLDLPFTDQVEAHLEFLQGISWSKSQVCALVFQGKGGKGIGNNYGGQCASFSGGNFASGTPPQTEVTAFNQKVTIGLRVKGGTYEALREGRPRGSAKYLPRNFSSGRVGIIWSGKLAGTVTSLKVKGKPDWAALLKEGRKK